MKLKPLFISIPHSGEQIPPEAAWLQGLPEPLLMCDVDRYVDQLYQPALHALALPFVKTEWHRYAIDLNRWKDDIDVDSVTDAANASGKFPRGLHWSITTKGERLMPGPISRSQHDVLVERYFEPFHAAIRAQYGGLRQQGHDVVYHIDAHSMPSLGTGEHRDPGEYRKDVVISDCKGVSCSKRFLEIVSEAYRHAGFSIAYNWPYYGGRVTETYGHPEKGQEAIQVELNRALYMDEETKQLRQELLVSVQNKIKMALVEIVDRL